MCRAGVISTSCDVSNSKWRQEIPKQIRSVRIPAIQDGRVPALCNVYRSHFCVGLKAYFKSDNTGIRFEFGDCSNSMSMSNKPVINNQPCGQSFQVLIAFQLGAASWSSMCGSSVPPGQAQTRK
jgi:hypothetical protein